MLVSELIEQLKKLEQNTGVFFGSNCDYGCYVLYAEEKEDGVYINGIE